MIAVLIIQKSPAHIHRQSEKTPIIPGLAIARLRLPSSNARDSGRRPQSGHSLPNRTLHHKSIEVKSKVVLKRKEIQSVSPPSCGRRFRLECQAERWFPTDGHGGISPTQHLARDVRWPSINGKHSRQLPVIRHFRLIGRSFGQMGLGVPRTPRRKRRLAWPAKRLGCPSHARQRVVIEGRRCRSGRQGSSGSARPGRRWG